MKILLVLSFLFVSTAHAVESNQSEANESLIRDNTWFVEAEMTIQSAAGDAAPLIGSTLDYYFNHRSSIGLKYLNSITGTGKTGAYRLGILLRHHFTDPSRTGLFYQPDLTANIVYGTSFLSTGHVLGLIHPFKSGFYLIGQAGFEASRYEANDTSKPAE